MSVVASFVGGWGHAEPLLDVARLAVERGHTVTFAGQRAVVPRLAALGFATLVVGPDTVSVERSPLLPVDRDGERRVIRDQFVTNFGGQRVHLLARILGDLSTDLVLCDEVDCGAIIAAERLGIPIVTINVIAAGRLLSAATVGDAWSALRVENGLTPDTCAERLAGDLMLAPFPASFRDPLLPRPTQWRPVRPSSLTVQGDDHHRERPFVYATLGTVFNVESGDVLRRVIDGLGIAHVEGLVTIGPNIEPCEFHRVPETIRIEQFVDQRDILGRCAAVVCHGGSGTLMAALSHGIPVVVIPLGADQPDNADRCLELGCGVVLDAVTATPASIAAAVRLVTTDPTFAANARQLANEAANQPTVAELTELTFLLAV